MSTPLTSVTVFAAKAAEAAANAAAASCSSTLSAVQNLKFPSLAPVAPKLFGISISLDLIAIAVLAGVTVYAIFRLGGLAKAESIATRAESIALKTKNGLSTELRAIRAEVEKLTSAAAVPAPAAVVAPIALKPATLVK